MPEINTTPHMYIFDRARLGFVDTGPIKSKWAYVAAAFGCGQLRIEPADWDGGGLKVFRDGPEIETKINPKHEAAEQKCLQRPACEGAVRQ